MSRDAHDFDMLVTHIILGDGTSCSLEFSEVNQSTYLQQLLTMTPPVNLRFGDAATMQELRSILAIYKHGENSSSHLNSSRDHSNDTENDALQERIQSLLKNRPLFMQVLELAARLELNDVIKVLSKTFRFIFETEVRERAIVPLLWSVERKEGDTFRPLQMEEVLRFREAVTRAFAMNVITSSVVRSSSTCAPPELESAQVSTIKSVSTTTTTTAAAVVGSSVSTREDASPLSFHSVVSSEQRWRQQLWKDRYFFPGAQQLGDLTQSVDPKICAINLLERSCFDEDFVNGPSGHPFLNRTWEADDTVQKCPICNRPFVSWSTLSFNMVRASHCRCCGRRICAQCTSWKLHRSIARLSKPGVPEEGTMRRVCGDCFAKAERLNENIYLCDVFITAGLSILDIALLRAVNVEWRGVAELCLTDFRSLLYQSTSWFSSVLPLTAKLLLNSVQLFVGHPEPLLLLFFLLDWDDTALVHAAHVALSRTLTGIARDFALDTPWKPSISHWHMMCTRACRHMIPPFFAVKMLQLLRRAPARSSVAESLRDLVTRKLLHDGIAALDWRVRECLVPLLLDVFDLCDCQAYVAPALLQLAREDRRLALVIYAETQKKWAMGDLSYDMLRDQVKRVDATARAETHEQFLHTLDFLDLLRDALGRHPPTCSISEIRTEFHRRLRVAGLAAENSATEGNMSNGLLEVKPMFFPFDTSVVITHIHIGRIMMMSSKLRPIVVPLVDANGKSRRILYKCENLEKDKVMCITSRFLQWVLRKRLRYVVPPTYHVMPLTSSSGIIEMVEEGRTVQNVVEQYKERRLLQYLFFLQEDLTRQRYEEQQDEQRQQQQQQQQQHNQQEQVGAKGAGGSIHVNAASGEMKRKVKVSESFLCSAKFFILINYIFAIGDRHRENVMIHPSGAIFHIDFGMLLTTTTIAELVTSSYVRFDRDLEECVIFFINKNDKPSKGDSDALSKFFDETAAWFLDVRPYAGMIYQLLSHIVHRGALDGVQSLEELGRLMRNTFMRDSSEETCRKLFSDRVTKSRGRTWLKDLSHDTQKRAWGMVSHGYQWLWDKTGLTGTPFTHEETKERQERRT